MSQPTTGSFNYLSDATQSSLYRNSKVMINRNLAGSDSRAIGLDYTPTEIDVADARALRGDQSITLEKNGFELVDSPRPIKLDFFDQQQVLTGYYDACAALVTEITGAPAFAFDHNIRSASGKKKKLQLKGGQEVQGPAHAVHGDYTLSSAPQRLKDLSLPPGANDTISKLLEAGESLLDGDQVDAVLEGGKRFAIINVWRNIAAEPVVTHPMAFCDGQTVNAEDLVVFEIHYSDRIGENYFAKHQEQHRWYYYPQVTPDEAILIKQWDSAGHLARTKGAQSDNQGDGTSSFSFHSAFKDPAIAADAPDRWSIEVRCVVLYDTVVV